MVVPKMLAWIFLGLASALFAALVAIFGKLGLSSLDSTLATTVRACIMAVFLCLVSLMLGKMSLLQTIDRTSLMFITLSGLSGALSWLAYFAALQLGPAGKVASLDRLSLVFVIFLSALFLGERLTWHALVGVACMVVGAFLIVG